MIIAFAEEAARHAPEVLRDGRNGSAHAVEIIGVSEAIFLDGFVNPVTTAFRPWPPMNRFAPDGHSSTGFRPWLPGNGVNDGLSLGFREETGHQEFAGSIFAPASRTTPPRRRPPVMRSFCIALWCELSILRSMR